MYFIVINVMEQILLKKKNLITGPGQADPAKIFR